VKKTPPPAPRSGKTQKRATEGGVSPNHVHHTFFGETKKNGGASRKKKGPKGAGVLCQGQVESVRKRNISPPTQMAKSRLKKSSEKAQKKRAVEGGT